jgi:oxygen-independent coproporphyrinogen III oxidase
MPEPVTALYIHLPFCRAKCGYCDFTSYPGLAHLQQPYGEALVAEAHFMARRFTGPLATIYLGGGTPSVLPASMLQHVLRHCMAIFGVAAATEVTVEANPGTLSLPWLRGLRRAGVNRISLGVQSFQAAELALLGRIHDVAAVRAAAAAARTAGFANLSLDLIFGLPNQPLADWQATLEQALALSPEHLSLYALSLEPGTRLHASVQRGELPEPDPDLAADMYELASDLLGQRGFRQYEISNWCRPGFECAHNLVYWHNRPYLGLGAGAHSSDGTRRWWNTRSVAQYLERLTAGQVDEWPSPAAEDGETLDRSLQMAETMMLGLRLTREGVSETGFQQRFGVALDAIYPSALREMADVGLLTREAGRVCLTPRGRLLGNRVFVRFLPEQDSG